jgi:hypothetical protein
MIFTKSLWNRSQYNKVRRRTSRNCPYSCAYLLEIIFIQIIKEFSMIKHYYLFVLLMFIGVSPIHAVNLHSGAHRKTTRRTTERLASLRKRKEREHIKERATKSKSTKGCCNKKYVPIFYGLGALAIGGLATALSIWNIYD